MSLMDDYEEYEDFDEFDDSKSGAGGAEESQSQGSSNRTFLIVAGIMGAILVLALVCMVVYATLIAPGNRGTQEAEAATIEAQNTSVALSAGLTAEADAWTETPTITPTKAPATPTPTRTPVLAPSQTPVGVDAEPTADQRTATVSALLTAQAERDLTATPAATALPKSGFMDDFQIPALLALAAGLVVVIFLARRLRTAG